MTGRPARTTTRFTAPTSGPDRASPTRPTAVTRNRGRSGGVEPPERLHQRQLDGSRPARPDRAAVADLDPDDEPLRRIAERASRATTASASAADPSTTRVGARGEQGIDLVGRRGRRRSPARAPGAATIADERRRGSAASPDRTRGPCRRRAAVCAPRLDDRAPRPRPGRRRTPSIRIGPVGDQTGEPRRPATSIAGITSNMRAR